MGCESKGNVLCILDKYTAYFPACHFSLPLIPLCIYHNCISYTFPPPRPIFTFDFLSIFPYPISFLPSALPCFPLNRFLTYPRCTLHFLPSIFSLFQHIPPSSPFFLPRYPSSVIRMSNLVLVFILRPPLWDGI